MTIPQVIACILGLVTGLAFIPVYEAAHFGFLRIWSPAGTKLRILVVMLLATLSACIASAILILLPGYLIGILPSHENAPYFGWPFLIGGLISRAIIELRKRHRSGGFE